jgi:hypothetical protein
MMSNLFLFAEQQWDRLLPRDLNSLKKIEAEINVIFQNLPSPVFVSINTFSHERRFRRKIDWL